MPPPKAPRRGRKPRKTTTGATTGAEGDAAASSQAAPSDIKPEEMTIEDLIRKLYEDRERAVKNDRAGAAVQATIAMARLLGLLPDKPGRTRANLMRKLGRSPAPPLSKFDGNYNDAARRIALLLRLAAKEKAEEADRAETVDGRERERPS